MSARRRSYRVHDAIFVVPPAKAFKNVRVLLGDGRATVRYFKPEHGPMCVYQFEKGESREVTEGALLKQLGTAGIAGTPNLSFNPQANAPRKVVIRSSGNGSVIFPGNSTATETTACDAGRGTPERERH